MSKGNKDTVFDSVTVIYLCLVIKGDSVAPGENKSYEVTI